MSDTMEKLNELSIFLLAYNEEDNIKKSINNALDAARKYTKKFEIIVILYEGSRDNTLFIVRDMMKKIPELDLVIQPMDHKGYGAALRMGIESSRYQYIFYTDADNQFDMNEIGLLIPYVGKYDIVSGYRKKRNDQFMRILAAKVYNLILDSIFFVYFKDVDSAFKIYNRRIFDKFKITCKTGMADAEILIKTKKKGMKIKEIPVSHYSRLDGKGTFDSGGLGVIRLSVVTNLLKDMFRLRKRLLFRRFD